MPNIETLDCQCGCNGTFTRESARGRKPKFAPGHKSGVAPTQPDPEATETPNVGVSEGTTLKAALSGRQLGLHVVEAMKPLLEREARRRKPKPGDIR